MNPSCPRRQIVCQTETSVFFMIFEENVSSKLGVRGISMDLYYSILKKLKCYDEYPIKFDFIVNTTD